jgi:hypothetical protein
METIRLVGIMDKKIKLGVFLLLFAVLSLAFYQINANYVVGAEEQSFTLFQFIGPIGAGFVSPFLAIIVILGVEVVEKVLLNDFTFSAFSVARFLPMLAAAYYFGVVKKNKRFGIVLPVLGMLLFWLHPIGIEAWGYPLLWLIPILATFFAEKHLFLRSLGATFQAHVVGSVAFLYAIGMPAEAWWALIPIVLVERGIFAAGISITYITFSSVLEFVAQMLRWNMGFLNEDGEYVPHAHHHRKEDD